MAGAGAAGGHGRQDAGRTSAGAAGGWGRTQPGRVRGSGRTEHCCTTLPRMLRIARALNAPALGSVRRAIVLPGRARARSRRTKPSATFGRKSGSASPMLPRRTQAGRESESITIFGVASTSETYARWERAGSASRHCCKKHFGPLADGLHPKLQEAVAALSHRRAASEPKGSARGDDTLRTTALPAPCPLAFRPLRIAPCPLARRLPQIPCQYPLTPYTMYHIV